MYNVFLLVLCLFVAFPVWSDGVRFEDPTRPLTYREAEKKKVKLTLQAIFNKPEGKKAIINGQLLQKGDRVYGARVVEIDDKYVIYEWNGRQGRLTLRDSIKLSESK